MQHTHKMQTHIYIQTLSVFLFSKHISQHLFSHYRSHHLFQRHLSTQQIRIREPSSLILRARTPRLRFLSELPWRGSRRRRRLGDIFSTTCCVARCCVRGRGTAKRKLDECQKGRYLIRKRKKKQFEKAKQKETMGGERIIEKGVYCQKGISHPCARSCVTEISTVL